MRGRTHVPAQAPAVEDAGGQSLSAMPVARIALIVAGLGVGGFGAVRLVGVGWPNLRAAVPWLVGGVVVHDALVAPAVLALCAAAAAVLPRWARAAGVAVLVVLGPVTVAGIPVLGRFGARSDNRTLLDRPYVAGWLVLAGLVLIGAAIAAVVRRHEGTTHCG